MYRWRRKQTKKERKKKRKTLVASGNISLVNKKSELDTTLFFSVSLTNKTNANRCKPNQGFSVANGQSYRHPQLLSMADSKSLAHSYAWCLIQRALHVRVHWSFTLKANKEHEQNEWISLSGIYRVYPFSNHSLFSHLSPHCHSDISTFFPLAKIFTILLIRVKSASQLEWI